MTGLVKVLIGAAAIVGGCIIAAVVSSDKKEEDKDVVEIVDAEEEKPSVLKRIKKAAEKKVVKILAWVALHMEQIEATSAVIGLVTGGFGIASAIRDWRSGNELMDRLDQLEDQVERTRREVINAANNLGKYEQACTEVLNENLKTIDNDILALYPPTEQAA